MFIIIKFSKQTTQERKRKIERVLSKKTKTLRVLNAVIVYVCVKVNVNDCLLLIFYLPN